MCIVNHICDQACVFDRARIYLYQYPIHTPGGSRYSLITKITKGKSERLELNRVEKISQYEENFTRLIIAELMKHLTTKDKGAEKLHILLVNWKMKLSP